MPSTTPLPKIMVAPNGARRNQAHHPNIPISDDALVDAVIQCQKAGADGAHLHIRDDKGAHLLDANRYRTVLDQLDNSVPEMYLQVTSESADIYEADQQQAIMWVLKPDYVSVAMPEMVRDSSNWPRATSFYHWADSNNVQIHHILYSPLELQAVLSEVSVGNIPGDHHLLQFVLGHYEGTNISEPDHVSDFTEKLNTAATALRFDWMVCEFGKMETTCLAAVRQRGNARIGFGNLMWNSDSSVAKDNAERVAELVSYL